MNASKASSMLSKGSEVCFTLAKAAKAIAVFGL
jgi:hypothetical protein